MPGVIVHELSHALFAEVTFVKTFHLEISPRYEDGLLRMGSVSIEKTDPVRRAIIGLAPIISGIIIISAVLFFFGEIFTFKNPLSSPSMLPLYVGVGWGIFLIANTMFSSKKDLEGALVLGLSVGFLFMVGVISLLLLEQNPLIFLNNISGWFRLDSIATSLSRTLLIPVFINASVVVIARLVRR